MYLHLTTEAGHSLIFLLCLLSALILAILIKNYLLQSHVPGPFFAAFSNFPRLFWVRSHNGHQKHIDLHKQFGDLVRMGPNCISVGDPREIQKIYGIRANFKKSDYYKVLQPMIRGKAVQGLFNTQDEGLHRSMKRPISGLYSMTNLVEFEPYADKTIEFLIDRLEQFLDPGKEACDLGEWLQWFAFDFMGEITFSKRLGFLDEARDVDGIMGSIWNLFLYASWVGQMPWLDRLWLKNPIVNWFLPVKNSPIVAFAQARAQERSSVSKESLSEYNSKDLMSRFIDIQAQDPKIPPWYVLAWTTSNVLAGSDTTAIMLRAIIFSILTHPETEKKLLMELKQARRENRLSEIVTWQESRSLPYLDACIKEAGRLHPAVGLLLERVVPAEGVELCGKTFAPNTVVGMNAWVVHRHEGVFGEDAAQWNPDRWLCSKERSASMERCLLTFGTGHRTCIGKNISYLEIYKLIPTLFANYEMTLSNDLKDYTVQNAWLVVQRGLKVELRRRNLGPRFSRVTLQSDDLNSHTS